MYLSCCWLLADGSRGSVVLMLTLMLAVPTLRSLHAC